MAAIKFVLFFAALSVASVSAETDLEKQVGVLWNDALHKLQNATNVIATNLNVPLPSDVVHTTVANITHALDVMKTQAEDKTAEAKTAILQLVNSVNQTVSEMTPENTKQLLQRITEKFNDLSSNLAGPVNEIKEAVVQSLQDTASAVQGAVQQAQTSAAKS